MNKESKRELVAKGALAIGQLASEPKKAINAAAQIAAGLVRGDGAKVFTQVFDSLSKNGELDPNFMNTSKGRYFIQEIDTVLRVETKDEESLKRKIKLFLAIASKKYSQHSFDEAQEVWKIVRALDSIDIKVLAASYRLMSEHLQRAEVRYTSLEGWVKLLSIESGLQYEEFVESAESALNSRRLLTGEINENYRLSRLGICVAEYLHEGDKLFEIAVSKK